MTILLAVVAARSWVDAVSGWVIAAGAVVAAAGVILAGVRAAVRGIRWLVRILEAIEERSRELEHNGGGSIKDATDATCARLSALEGAVADVRRDVADVAERLDRHLIGGRW